MRRGIAIGLCVLVGDLAASSAQAVERWRISTDEHHAGCVRDALPDTPLTIDLRYQAAILTIEVAPSRCAYVIDRLLAYGIDEAEIDGEPRSLLELDDVCGTVDRSDPRWFETRAHQRSVRELWDTFELEVRADALGSRDAAHAQALATRCRSMVAELRNPPGADLAALSELRQRTFTYDGWSGTLADLERSWCPRVEAAARRIDERAATYARLGPGRRAIFERSPEGFYVPGGRAPTRSAKTLVRAKVWIEVEDTTLLDTIGGACPLDSPAVTTYTRYTFAGDALIARKVTTTCAPFSRRRLR